MQVPRLAGHAPGHGGLRLAPGRGHLQARRGGVLPRPGGQVTVVLELQTIHRHPWSKAPTIKRLVGWFAALSSTVVLCQGGRGHYPEPQRQQAAVPLRGVPGGPRPHHDPAPPLPRHVQHRRGLPAPPQQGSNNIGNKYYRIGTVQKVGPSLASW